MGNRGILHDTDRTIVRDSQVRRWIACRLEFRGRHRDVMSPGSWTELFFLDEATALAAGHRPCAECRHARFLAFCNAWGTAHSSKDALPWPTATIMDDRSHAERIAADGARRSLVTALDELPDGGLVSVAAWGAQA